MSFAEPLRLVLLVVPVLLAVLAWRSLRRRSKAAVRFAQTELLADIAPKRSWRQVVPPVLALAGVALLVVGLAHPERQTEVEREARQLVLAFDVSYSMEATDVPPSRLEVARSAAKDFVEAAPDDVEVGLIQFAGTIISVTEPTTDKAQLLRELDDIELRPSTAIGDAIVTALEMLRGDEATGSIVVLSDGESTVGLPDADAAELAATRGVPVSTISFGTPNGFITQDGEQVAVPSSPESLAAIAEATGGLTAAPENAESLYQVFDQIQASVAPEFVTQDLADVANLAALLALVVAFGLSLRWFARLL